MNKVLLTGRLTRDPEMRSLASGKNVTTVNSAVDQNTHLITLTPLVALRSEPSADGEHQACCDDDGHQRNDAAASHQTKPSGRRLANRLAGPSVLAHL